MTFLWVTRVSMGNVLQDDEHILGKWQNFLHKSMYDDYNDEDTYTEQNNVPNPNAHAQNNANDTELPAGRPARNIIPNRRYFNDEMINNLEYRF